jgi:hypothetical protein
MGELGYIIDNSVELVTASLLHEAAILRGDLGWLGVARERTRRRGRRASSEVVALSLALVRV